MRRKQDAHGPAPALSHTPCGPQPMTWPWRSALPIELWAVAVACGHRNGEHPSAERPRHSRSPQILNTPRPNRSRGWLAGQGGQRCVMRPRPLERADAVCSITRLKQSAGSWRSFA